MSIAYTTNAGTIGPIYFQKVIFEENLADGQCYYKCQSLDNTIRNKNSMHIYGLLLTLQLKRSSILSTSKMFEYST